jgi:MFS family permease
MADARRVGAKALDLLRRAGRAPAFRALHHRDFRLLWSGAVVSFTGVQVQGVAQGYLVYEMTGDEAMLGLVMFASLAPVSLFGPVLGVFSDVWDRRTIMVVASVVLALGAAFLGTAAHYGFIQYWHLIAVALMNGFVTTLENPARQSIVREVVPEYDLPAAVPSMGMTFNLARVVGPAIGGILTYRVGPEWCFWINALSFAGMIGATLMIRADLSPKEREPQPVRDLLTEGMLYTMRDKALRTLFFLESVTSFFGIFYLGLMAAIAKDMLGLDAKGLGAAMSSVGFGALVGLVALVSVSHRPWKPLIVRLAMSVFAVAMLVVGLVHVAWLAFVMFGVMGACTMLQFNTTNTLFQILSPAQLRGRVLSMHMWAVMGVSPFGTLFFGWFAGRTSLPAAFLLGGSVMAVGAAFAWGLRRNVYEPELRPA